MAKDEKKIRYFKTHNSAGQELPHIQWSRKINAIVAMAHPAGLYITAIPEVWELLEAQGYVEADASWCDTLKIENPVADRVDYSARENLMRYSKYM